MKYDEKPPIGETMAPTVRRVDLPSGGWWDLVIRPRWKHVCPLLLEARDPVDPAAADGAHGCLVERALVSFTAAWSFGEPVTEGSLALRDQGDVVAVMEVFGREIVSGWAGGDRQALAEELFEGLARGVIPAPFAESHVLALTGWTWAALQETPVDVVDRMAVYLAVRQARETGGTLDVREAGNG